MKQERAAQVPVLDGFGGIAAIGILLYQCWLLSGEPALGGGPVHDVLSAGFLADTLFFVPSGFVLFLAVARRGGVVGPLRPYARRRLARVVPPGASCSASGGRTEPERRAVLLPMHLADFAAGMGAALLYVRGRLAPRLAAVVGIACGLAAFAALGVPRADRVRPAGLPGGRVVVMDGDRAAGAALDAGAARGVASFSV